MSHFNALLKKCPSNGRNIQEAYRELQEQTQERSGIDS